MSVAVRVLSACARSRPLRVLFAATTAATMAVASIVGCGSSFPAVKAAGTMGQKIQDQSAVFEHAGDVCDVAAAVSGQTPKVSCKTVRDEANRWGKVASLLAAYATKLTELSQAKDPAVGDQVSSAVAAATKAKWIGLTKDQGTAAGKLATFVADLLTKAYREHILQDVIGGEDADVQLVATAFIGGLDLQVKNIDEVEKTLDSTLGVINLAVQHPPGPPTTVDAPSWDGGHVNTQEQAFEKYQVAANTAIQSSARDFERYQTTLNSIVAKSTNASLRSVWGELEAIRRSYQQAQKAVDAFAKAHAKLKAAGEKLDAGELLSEVITAVQDIYALEPTVDAGNGGG